MAVSSFNRELSVSIAKVADQAQRYDDMAEIMKKVAKSVGELTADERILLSKAYEKKILSRRGFWKMLSLKLESDMLKRVWSRGTSLETLTRRLDKELILANFNLTRVYRDKVEAEMCDICADILSILDHHLIPSCKIGDHTSCAYYYKMKGDYYTYLAEFKSGSANKEAADDSFRVIPPTDPVPEGVALTYKDIFGSFDREKFFGRASSERTIVDTP